MTSMSLCHESQVLHVSAVRRKCVDFVVDGHALADRLIACRSGVFVTPEIGHQYGHQSEGFEHETIFTRIRFVVLANGSEQNRQPFAGVV